MDAGSTLRAARRRAGLSQRALATRTGIAQPTIARIESGAADPRLDTLDTLLCSCGEELMTRPRAGSGIDRSQLREMLRLTPRRRLELLVGDVAGLERLLGARS